MASVFREVVVDARDAQALGAWWSEVLGWPVTNTDEGWAWLSRDGTPTADPPLLVFVPVPEPKSVKNRVHIDLNPSGCEQAEELERLKGLGAREVDIGQGDTPWIVLADPEGNEFCLLGRRVD
jgi:catechol-2,3-dioxygenase